MRLSACGAASGALGEERAAPGVTGGSEPRDLGSIVPSAAHVVLWVPVSEPYWPVRVPPRDHCCSATKATRCTRPALAQRPRPADGSCRRGFSSVGRRAVLPTRVWLQPHCGGGRGPCVNSASLGRCSKSSLSVVRRFSGLLRGDAEPSQCCHRGGFIKRS